jgi:hypothetical protein
MTSFNDSLVLLTVRGTLVPQGAEAACKAHNDTAGSPDGIAAARALGDLSHKVYAPVPGLGAEDGELLFLDWWKTAEGIGTFFSDPRVHGMASVLFTQREGVTWMPARDAFGFELPPPMAKAGRFLGIVRGPVPSPEHAIGVFRASLAPKLSDARRRGQLSHHLFVKIPLPGASAAPELLGIDHWCDAAGMKEHYESLGGGYEKAFTGKPQTSVWQQATGGVWSEW